MHRYERHIILGIIRTTNTEFVTILVYILKPYATIAYSHPCSHAIRPDIPVRTLLCYTQNLTNSKYSPSMYDSQNDMSLSTHDNKLPLASPKEYINEGYLEFVKFCL